MIEKPYFVILNNPCGDVIPMIKNDVGDLMMFESEIEAIAKAEDNPLGSNYGFEVFELGGGCHYV